MGIWSNAKHTEVQGKVYVLSDFNVPSETRTVFHNVSNYDYHFIIKELANKFEGQLECFGKTQKSTKLSSFR